MKPPPFLLAAALLIWGWQTGLLAFALLMAVVLEAARWIEWRMDFGVKDFNRVVDLVSLLGAIAGVYCVLTRDATNQVMVMLQQTTGFSAQTKAASSVSQTAFIYFQWLPMILFPVVAALAYSTSERYPRSCFFLLARRRAARAGVPQPIEPGVHLGYPYFGVLLFCASLANQRNEWFYFALCAVVAGALWVTRPRRFSNVIWVAVLIVVVKAGFYAHSGLNQLQTVIENKVATWVSSLMRRSGERGEAFTAIGKIGQLKLSGKIVLRVEPEKGPVPMLLRDTTFNRFDSPRWSNNPRSAETDVTPIDDLTVWPLLGKSATNVVRISGFSTRGQAILAAPPGTATLQNLPAGEVKTNGQGVIRALSAPDFLHYTAHYGPGDSVQSPPILKSDRGPVDLIVPEAELVGVQQIAEELNLLELPRSQRPRVVWQFFASNFKYGSFLPTSLDRVPQGMTPLRFFLTKNRVGHCEYYATATALLLRYAGIPARYAYGWSVQEPDKGSAAFIVRERHAHAWCIYWDAAASAWVDLDTTPGEWARTEEQNASIWEPLSDRWSRAWFGFSKWRWYGGAGEWQNWLLLALLGLIALLAWRLLAQQRRRRTVSSDAADAWLPRPGLDSEFFEVEGRLADLGLGRRDCEAFGDWLARIEPLSTEPVEPLRRLLELHYRLRFDPRGLSDNERVALRDGVRAWLSQTKAT